MTTTFVVFCCASGNYIQLVGLGGAATLRISVHCATYLVWVATELSNILLYPSESHHLILKPKISICHSDFIQSQVAKCI